MEIVALDLADDEAVAACHAVSEEADRADDPFAAPMSARLFHSRLSSGWSGGSCETWYVPGGDGTVAGWYRTEWPDLENQDRVYVQLVVGPARRRDGIGAALLRHAAGRAADSGRGILSGGVQEGSAGEAFAMRVGAVLGMADVRRVQDLAKIPAGAITRLREKAASAAAGYSLMRWVGVIPQDRIDQVAALNEALNDSPRDPAIEPTAWTPERVRDRLNSRIARSPMHYYSLAATDDGTGEMAALTVVAIDPDVPCWGHQLNTAVTRPHRGHRLGMLVKTAMLDWLAEAEPRLEYIETWNAASNEFMISINESLGYTVRGRFRSAELPVAALAAPR